jgi:MFS family permease
MGRYFGRKAFGSIFGISNIFLSAAMFLGPIYYGWMYDTTGSYVTAFTIFAIVAPICAVAICLLARAPKLPAAG